MAELVIAGGVGGGGGLGMEWSEQGKGVQVIDLRFLLILPLARSAVWVPYLAKPGLTSARPRLMGNKKAGELEEIVTS